MKVKERWKNRSKTKEIQRLRKENEHIRAENKELQAMFLNLQKTPRIPVKVKKYMASYTVDRFAGKPSDETIYGILANKIMAGIKRELVVETHKYVNGDIEYTAELQICREGERICEKI